VNELQVAGYFEALLASVTIRVIIPLLILILVSVFIWWMIAKASANNDFHIEEVLLDAKDGKVSSTRLLAFLAFAISSWYLAVDVINGAPNYLVYLIYLLGWSGSLLLKEAVLKWNGQLPFAKSGES
jgi:hypothetical protein